ncbi:MAG: hypothetical protein N4A50_06235 [Vallitalea sp.]|jgi:hypothetical protein|nr:hypothetical protein [Vallitalea sp.]
MKKNLENVMHIKGVPNMITMNEEDHKELYGTIVNIDWSIEMLDEAKKDGDIKMIKTIMEFYVKSMREHKILWGNLLNKYVGVEYASEYSDIYRYDTQRKVIFLFKQKECTACENGC